ncbi:MAG: hypothetical protein ABID09_04765 [Candidatus Omnitrophota bacterium]
MIEEYIKENWRSVNRKRDIPDRLNIIKLSGQETSEACMNLLLFENNDAHPSYFVKVNRRPVDLSRLKEEFSALERAGQLLGGDYKGTIPKAVFLGSIDDFTMILVEEYIHGRFVLLHKYNDLKIFLAKAMDWIKNFYLVTRKEGSVLPWSIFKNEFTKSVAGMELDHGLRRKLDRIVNAVERRRPKDLPLSSLQGDFSFNNILIQNDGRVCVTDWEDYCDNALPFLDIEFLLFHAGLFCGAKIDHIENFNHFFKRDSLTFELVNHHLEDYCFLLGIDKSLFYLASVKDTVDVMRNGYGRHKRIPMQRMEFLETLANLALREID